MLRRWYSPVGLFLFLGLFLLGSGCAYQRPAAREQRPPQPPAETIQSAPSGEEPIEKPGAIKEEDLQS